MSNPVLNGGRDARRLQPCLPARTAFLHQPQRCGTAPFEHWRTRSCADHVPDR